MDLYSTLGVRPHACDEEICKAYETTIEREKAGESLLEMLFRKRARRARQVSHAFEILANPITRADYDKQLRAADLMLRYPCSFL